MNALRTCVVAALILAPSVVASCTPAERASITKFDQGIAIPWTKVACEVLPNTGVPIGFVDLGCTLVEGAEIALEDSWVDATPPATSASVTIRLPLASAKILAAKYPTQVHVP